ncbi:hypothetical protein BBP40_010197 [Aspergillus hancockii]|nr:hypothetical protein BBP40_010197 [Aspergillus hancockii]
MTTISQPPPGLYITGLGSQYPPYLLGPGELDKIKKLLQINRSSGIETRAAIRSYESGFAAQSSAPSISDIDQFYRNTGIDLTSQACNPGYDLLVNRKLGLSPNVDRMLLHGVGCAGGLAIMRAAAQIACGASMRRKPVRILAFACELCTLNVRHDLDAAEKSAGSDNISIAGALFSDAAAAFVLCNEYAMEEEDDEIAPLFQLLEWGNGLVPDTLEHMAVFAVVDGYRTVLTRDVPQYTKNAIGPLFNQLLPSYQSQVESSHEAEGEQKGNPLGISDFDWALHPGGEAIIEGAKQVLELTEDQLKASREIYRTRGNSSSPTVLIVLDRLRSLSKKEHVVATSFGPGLGIEMAMWRRVRYG